MRLEPLTQRPHAMYPNLTYRGTLVLVPSRGLRGTVGTVWRFGMICAVDVGTISSDTVSRRRSNDVHTPQGTFTQVTVRHCMPFWPHVLGHFGRYSMALLQSDWLFGKYIRYFAIESAANLR